MILAAAHAAILAAAPPTASAAAQVAVHAPARFAVLAAGRPGNALVSVQGVGGLVRLGLVVVVCAGLAAGINRWGQLGHGRDDLLAALRASLQLGVVGLLILAVLGSWWLTLGFIILMLSVASLTAGRRLSPKGLGPNRQGPRRLGLTVEWRFAAAPVVLGAVPVAAGLMLSGLIPHQTIAVVPIVGILIGGAMTATTLAGRRSLDALRTRHGEYEAALSIGLLPRDSALLIARADAALALVPGLDQTRTVGLVTLPGAFVGMLLGGASPLQAAAVQLVVLVALLLVQAIAVLVTVELVARGRFSPGGLQQAPSGLAGPTRKGQANPARQANPATSNQPRANP